MRELPTSYLIPFLAALLRYYTTLHNLYTSMLLYQISYVLCAQATQPLHPCLPLTPLLYLHYLYTTTPSVHATCTTAGMSCMYLVVYIHMYTLLPEWTCIC